MRVSLKLHGPVKRVGLKLWLLALLMIGDSCAHEEASISHEPMAAKTAVPSVSSPQTNSLVRAEQIRNDCVQGRRLICGRILNVLPDGLVVESGYTDLLRPPLTESWVVPGTAVARRDTAAIELNEPGTPCFGLVFLTDLPRRPKPNNYDYVVIMGYPAGQYAYTPAPGVEKMIRKFAAGLESAVRLKLQTETGGR
jgi:hypothetical protein